MAMWVLAERLMDRARHERGLSYDVDLCVSLVDSEQLEIAVAVDAREGLEAEVAAILWEEVRKLAADGPTDAELSHEMEGARERHADPRAVVEDLDHLARAHLFGLPVVEPEQHLERLGRVTSADVAALVTASLPTALLVVPEDTQLHLPGVERGGCSRSRDALVGTVYRLPLHARVVNRAARKCSLVRTAHGIGMTDEDGDVHHVPFPDVVGVLVDGDTRVVFGRSGCLITVSPDLFAGIGPLVRDIDRSVPGGLRYQVSALNGH